MTTTSTSTFSLTRRILTAASGIALAASLAGCGAPADPERDCLPVALPQAPPALIMIVATHAGAPAPNVPVTAAPVLQATLAAGNPVNVIALDGTPALLSLPGMRPVSRNTCQGFATTLAGAANAVIAAVQAASADADGNDLYAALNLAGNTAHANGWDGATVLVVDSGLAERPTSPINFAQENMTSADPDQEVATYAEQVAAFAVASQPLNLTGLTVDFQGLGQSALPQLPLSPAEQQIVSAIWAAVATKAGAAQVHLTPVPRTGPGPETSHSIELTPIAPVTVFTPPTPRAPTTLTLRETDVRFAHGSADLSDPATAKARLAQVVAWLASNPAHTATLYGRTDSSGSYESNIGLSTRRSETVKAAILDAHTGIDPDQIKTIGEGESKAIPDVLADGSLDPATSAANRHVLIVMTTS